MLEYYCHCWTTREPAAALPECIIKTIPLKKRHHIVMMTLLQSPVLKTFVESVQDLHCLCRFTFVLGYPWTPTCEGQANSFLAGVRMRPAVCDVKAM